MVMFYWKSWHLGIDIGCFRDSGRKVEDPDMLERIRLTIINNLLKYHPVCVLNSYAGLSLLLLLLLHLLPLFLIFNFYFCLLPVDIREISVLFS